MRIFFDSIYYWGGGFDFYLTFSIFYGFSGLTRLDSLFTLFFLEVEHILIIQIVIHFVICAFFFKVAIAPFHVWSPDIYEGECSLVSLLVFFWVFSFVWKSFWLNSIIVSSFSQNDFFMLWDTILLLKNTFLLRKYKKWINDCSKNR